MKSYILVVSIMSVMYNIAAVRDVGIEIFNAAAAVLHGEIAFGCSLDEDITDAR